MSEGFAWFILGAFLLVAFISFCTGLWYNGESHKDAQLKAFRDVITELERRLRKKG